MALIHQDRTQGYLRDILDQPQALDATLNWLRRSPGLGTIPADLADGEFRRIVLTGMGSSYHALYPLFLKLIRAGLTPIMIETSELIHYAPGLIEPKALFVVVSQSGQSVEIIRLIERVNKQATLIALTNSSSSPLALNADQVVLTQAGTESTVSCKTYQAALMALACIGDVLCGNDIQAGLRDLSSASGAVSRYLACWEKHVDDLMSLLKDVRNLFLVGRGASLAGVGTGALITKEAAHIFAEGMSCAAFRHGPIEMMSGDTLVVVFGGDARTTGLNRQLADDVRRAGGKSALVIDEDTPGAFHLPVAQGSIRPILEILPVEMMTLAFAELRGCVAGTFRFGSKVTSVE